MKSCIFFISLWFHLQNKYLRILKAKLQANKRLHLSLSLYLIRSNDFIKVSSMQKSLKSFFLTSLHVAQWNLSDGWQNWLENNWIWIDRVKIAKVKGPNVILLPVCDKTVVQSAVVFCLKHGIVVLFDRISRKICGIFWTYSWVILCSFHFLCDGPTRSIDFEQVILASLELPNRNLIGRGRIWNRDP